jgi:hypothetical protein
MNIVIDAFMYKILNQRIELQEQEIEELKEEITLLKRQCGKDQLTAGNLTVVKNFSFNSNKGSEDLPC